MAINQDHQESIACAHPPAKSSSMSHVDANRWDGGDVLRLEQLIHLGGTRLSEADAAHSGVTVESTSSSSSRGSGLVVPSTRR